MMRTLSAIARDIAACWPNVYFGAAPYLSAMRELEGVDDVFGHDGARGDPAALPSRIVRMLAAMSAGVVGYTHAWRRPDCAWLRDFAMASVESLEGAAHAHAAGWRTYRVRPAGTAPGDRPEPHPGVRAPAHVKREVECPAMSHGRT